MFFLKHFVHLVISPKPSSINIISPGGPLFNNLQRLDAQVSQTEAAARIERQQERRAEEQKKGKERTREPMPGFESRPHSRASIQELIVADQALCGLCSALAAADAIEVRRVSWVGIHAWVKRVWGGVVLWWVITSAWTGQYGWIECIHVICGCVV